MAATQLPASPPAFPIGRRLRHGLARAWPALVWVAAATGAAWLYAHEVEEGQTLAYSEILEVALTPELAGRIASSSVTVGAKVERGALLVALDPEDVDARLRFAELETRRIAERAEAQKAHVERATRPARNAALCEADPQRLRLELDRLTADQATDRGEGEALDAEITRLRGLTEKQIVTAERLEQLVVRRTVIEKRMEARAEQLRGLEACFGVTADLELLAAQERLRLLQRERGRHDLLAPVAGVVSEILHHPGEWVSAGTPVARIVVPRPGRAVAYIGGRIASDMKVGARAILTPREHAGPSLHGKVVALGPRFERVPLRLRFIPSIPQWGRIATIQLDDGSVTVAGELYNARFEP